MSLDPEAATAERFTLRDYQIDFIKRLYAAISVGHKKIACVAPTGAGKTILMSQIAEHAVKRGLRVLILVHLDVLVGQTYDKLHHFGLAAQCGFIKAGWPENRDVAVQIASIQTLAKRTWWQEWHADLVIYDEAHTTLFSKVGQHVLYRSHAKAIALAFTATPYRLSKREGLGDHLQTLIAAPVPGELQKLGMLAPMKYFGLPTADQINLGEVRTVAGDFAEEDLKNACDRPELIQRIVEEWHRLTPGKRTIAFCVGVEHAEHVAAAFRAAGVPADLVTGDTPIPERQKRYRALGAGELLVLSSCNVISIGFDEPSVEVGLLLRPTQSLALHHQQIGRVMRLSPKTGKTHGIILDQSGNLIRLGFPEDVQTYELIRGEQHEATTDAPKKQCPQCNSILYAFVMQCPNCGLAFVEKEKLQNTDNLVEIALAERLKVIQQELRYIKAFHGLRRQGYRQGQKPDWAAMQFQEKFGLSPKKNWCRGSIYGNTPTEADYEAYFQHLQSLSQSQRDQYNWIQKEFLDEFGKQAVPWIAKRILTVYRPLISNQQI